MTTTCRKHRSNKSKKLEQSSMTVETASRDVFFRGGGGGLEQQRRRRLRNCHLKSEVALLQTLSRLFHLIQFVECWQFFLKLNSNRLSRSSGKEKESPCLVLTSFAKREIKGSFTSLGIRAVRAKKCTKEDDAPAFFAVLVDVAVVVA